VLLKSPSERYQHLLGLSFMDDIEKRVLIVLLMIILLIASIATIAWLTI
jgi:hypothetical protein